MVRPARCRHPHPLGCGTKLRCGTRTTTALSCLQQLFEPQRPLKRRLHLHRAERGGREIEVRQRFGSGVFCCLGLALTPALSRQGEGDARPVLGDRRGRLISVAAFVEVHRLGCTFRARRRLSCDRAAAARCEVHRLGCTFRARRFKPDHAAAKEMVRRSGAISACSKRSASTRNARAWTLEIEPLRS